MIGDDRADDDEELPLDDGQLQEEVTAVGGSIGAELFRVVLQRSPGSDEGRLDDCATWLLSLAVAGVLENCGFEALCRFADDLGRRRCDPALDLAGLIQLEEYEALRARTHGGAPARQVLEDGFRERMRNLYLRTVKRARQV